MKKLILTLTFCAIAAGAAFAQNNMQAMRFLAVDALMDYGQKLYDRGDYNEAGAVFKHVLEYDSNQPQALQYLKKIGQLPKPTVQVQANKVDISDAKALKSAIEAEKQNIKTLQDQIMKMKDNMDSPSSEEILN